MPKPPDDRKPKPWRRGSLRSRSRPPSRFRTAPTRASGRGALLERGLPPAAIVGLRWRDFVQLPTGDFTVRYRRGRSEVTTVLGPVATAAFLEHAEDAGAGAPRHSDAVVFRSSRYSPVPLKTSGLYSLVARLRRRARQRAAP